MVANNRSSDAIIPMHRSSLYRALGGANKFRQLQILLQNRKIIRTSRDAGTEALYVSEVSEVVILN